MQRKVMISVALAVLFSLAKTGQVSAFYARVQTADAKPVAGAAVTFARFDTTAYSNDSGIVSFTTHVSAFFSPVKPRIPASLRMTRRNIVIDMPAAGNVDVQLYSLSGKRVFSEKRQLARGRVAMEMPVLGAGIYLLRGKIGDFRFARKVNPINGCFWQAFPGTTLGKGSLAKRTAFSDTAFFNKTGFFTVRRPFARYSDDLGIVVLDSSALQGPVKAVSAGESHTMFIEQDNTLWAVGVNDSGQHGNANTSWKTTPAKVMSDVSAVSARGNFTMILKSDGSLWATGANKSGQLGSSTAIKITTPEQVLTNVGAVYTSRNHTLAIRSDNTLWAMGNNGFGQLGDGTDSTRNIPARVMSNVLTASAGEYHSTIVKNDNTLWACGQNYYGQLGDGSVFEKHIPVQIMSDVSAVSAGDYHTMIIKKDNTLWATGDNSFGQLGDGTYYCKTKPTQVMSGVAKVSAGAGYTMVIKLDGTLWAMGYNHAGQLGAGDTLKRNTPVQIAGGVADVSAGYYYTMILKQNGTLWTTGSNHCFGDQMPFIYPTMVVPAAYHGLIVSGGSGSGSYLPGTNVQISAIDSIAPHNRFHHWGGPDSVVLWSVKQKQHTLTMPARDIVVMAVYRELPYLKVMAGSGSGWYDSAVSVKIAAYDSSAANRYFSRWGGPDSALVSVRTTSATTLAMPGRQAMVRALFGSRCSLSVSGGTGSGTFVSGSTVWINAFDSTISQRGFDHWGGQDSACVLNGLDMRTSLIMPDRNVAVAAVYADAHVLTAYGATNSGSFFIPRTMVSIVANDSTQWHRAFDHWGGPDSSLVITATAQSTYFAMPNRAATITAVYRDMWSLTVTNGTGSGWFGAGQKDTVRAFDSTQANRIFDHWGGPDSAYVVKDTNASAIFIMPSKNAAITAVYHTGCTITFDKNGADVNPVNEKINRISSGRTIALWPMGLSRQGYAFAGWNTRADGSGETFFTSIPVTADLTIYAQWRNTFAAVSVSARNCYSMVLSNDGIVWAFGQNFSGIIGYSYSDCQTPMPVTNGIASILASDKHSLFIKQDHTLWGCGWNMEGELGDGTTTISLTPIQIMSGVSAVSSMFNYTMILKQDGTLWATGENFYGQLGLGDTISRSTPAQVMSGVSAVSAGMHHTMILKQDKTLWCTGRNDSGQLGLGDARHRRTPVQVTSGVIGISAGGFHTLILKQDNSLWSCGANYSGQLGDQTIINRQTPVQVATGVMSISAGLNHSMFVKQDSSAWATGDNYYGQLGDRTKVNKSIPVCLFSLGKVSALSAGFYHSLALRPDETVWATGSNYHGQLGDNTKTDKTAFVRVMPQP
jgi:uncharacterized repeat protein (TIGR02543 family)